MRLTHFAFASTVVLLAITSYLAWEGQQAAKSANQKHEFLERQRQAELSARPEAASMVPLPPAVSITPPVVPVTPVTPVPTVPTVPGAARAPVPEPELATMAGSGALPGGGLTVPKSVVAAEAKGLNTNTLSAAQKSVIAARGIAKVKTVVKDQGFVVIDAGSDQRILAGQKYEIRRDSAVLAKVTISDTVEPTEAVANLDLASIPPGVSIEPGDEVIESVGR